MNPTTFDLERGIARCRTILSAIAIVAVYIDPTPPTLTRWLPLTGGAFSINPYARAVMFSHLAYSLTAYLLLARHLASTPRLALASTWLDVFFGVAIAVVTEGATSPFSAFFAFAVVTAGLRAGLRMTLLVTTTSVALYLALILIAAPDNESRYLMRPAYVAITGYLVGYLGQQRLNQEARIRELEANAQRERIARNLHDGYAQALSGVNLRLESCRELFRRGQHAAVLTELTDLQAGVNREHDELRAYIRSLVDLEMTEVPREPSHGPRFLVRAEFEGRAFFVEQVLQIMLEGTRNVRRHARARSASIDARCVAAELVVSIDDDGVGFSDPTKSPWSIASRVAESGGRMALDGGTAGAHLVIRLPTT